MRIINMGVHVAECGEGGQCDSVIWYVCVERNGTRLRLLLREVK